MKSLQVVPFLLEILAILLEERTQPVGNFLGDIGGYLLYVTVALEIRAAYIQRNIW